MTVWRYDTVDGADRAAEVLLDLADPGDSGGTVLLDAATVRWEAGKRKPRTQVLFADGAQDGALSGGFWGLLFGLTFYVPLLGAAIGVAPGAITGSLTDVGIDDGFVNRVRDHVTPGTSALFLLSSDAVLDRVHDAFTSGPKGHLIHTDLTPEQESALREIFGD